jgi:hypothetical protein
MGVCVFPLTSEIPPVEAHSSMLPRLHADAICPLHFVVEYILDQPLHQRRLASFSMADEQEGFSEHRHNLRGGSLQAISNPKQCSP